ncbi:hypothetical protein JQ615_11970 [Bradyrhizobium jicamae]|uniref:Uncharacterized protein n=1 Tax=Bradyrhizobium jicamae TaxID=280332 RepID=A0ABS5FH62_9BRAD|nr:hypothetical protein [Bradyrhizobium jicamae]MBR0796106.1 hypothetical protein [Bradyrhizobium jicamae]
MPSYSETMTSVAALMRDGPTKATLLRLVDVHNKIESEGAKIAGDGDRSPSGKTKASRDLVGKNASELLKARKFVEGATKRHAEKRASIELPAIDKTDAAGAALRGEMRNHLRGMSSLAERKAFLATASLPYLLAALEAPDELTGINVEVREAARSKAIDASFPGKLAELEKERADIQLLDNATKAFADTARNLAGLPNERALNEFVSANVPDHSRIDVEVERMTSAA